MERDADDTTDGNVPMSMSDAGLAKIDQLIELGRPDEAEPLVRSYISDHGDDPAGYVRLTQVLAGQNRIAEAMEAIDRGVALGPDNPHALYVRAALLLDTGKHSECVAQCTQALRIMPNNADLLIMRGMAYQRKANRTIKIKKRTDEKARASTGPMYLALDDLEAALQLMPHDAEPHKAMARFALHNEWSNVALEHAQTALSIDPNDANAHLLFGAAKEQLGDVRTASEAYVAAGRADVRSDAGIKQLRRLGRPAAVVGGVSFWVINRMVRAGVIAGRNAGLLVGVLVVAVVLGGATIWYFQKRKVVTAEMSAEARAALERDKELRGSATERVKRRFGR